MEVLSMRERVVVVPSNLTRSRRGSARVTRFFFLGSRLPTLPSCRERVSLKYS